MTNFGVLQEIELVAVRRLFAPTQDQEEGRPNVGAVLNRWRADISPAILPMPVDELFDLNSPTFAACAKQAPGAIGALELVLLLDVYRLMSQFKYNSFAREITRRRLQ